MSCEEAVTSKRSLVYCALRANSQHGGGDDRHCWMLDIGIFQGDSNGDASHKQISEVPNPGPRVTGPQCRSLRRAIGFARPHYFNNEFTIMKQTKIPRWENATLGIGFQFFNFLNHPNFGFPITGGIRYASHYLSGTAAHEHPGKWQWRLRRGCGSEDGSAEGRSEILSTEGGFL